MSAQVVVSAVAAVAVPLLGLFLQATPRHRLRGRVNEYLDLAERFADHDAGAADRLRRLARDTAERLERMDRRSLRRKLDPAAVFALVFLMAPAGAVFYLALDWDGHWFQWPVLILSALWVVVWAIAGVQQLWKEHDDAEDPKQTSQAS